MAIKRITPLLLAASIFATGFTGVFLSMSNCQPACALTSIDELTDVDNTNWAYDALKTLVEKYHVIEGYPDKTFRGARYANRYELAAALNATVWTMGKEIARVGAEKASKEDLATVAKLQEEFATELTALQARATALEARATKIEAKNDEQDNRLSVLEKVKLYGDVSFGGIADMNNNSTASRDAISAIGRTRLNLDYPVIQDRGDNSVVGPGFLHSRLIAAYGRVSPVNANGSTAIVNNTLSGYSEIAADSSLFNEGIQTSSYINGSGITTTAITGADTRANAYVDSAYYSQILRIPISKNPDWKTAITINSGLSPWRDFYFKSPYQGNELTQFQNTGLVVNPAILPNFTAPRIGLQIRQDLGRYLNFIGQADVYSVSVANLIDAGIGLTAGGDFGYDLGYIGNKLGIQSIASIPGDAYGGYYFIHSPGTLVNSIVTPTGIGSTSLSYAQGFYAGLNQAIYKGIGVFGNFALNNSSVLSALLSSLQNGTGSNVMYFNSAGVVIDGVRQSWSTGIEIPFRALPDFLTFGGKRQRDAIGVGYVMIFPTTTLQTNGSTISEKVLEAYYRLQVNDGFSIVPSFQWISDRGGSTAGTNNESYAVGIRTNYTF